MTRPSLADIEKRVEDVRRNAQYGKESRSRRLVNEASAADVPTLTAAVRDVLTLAARLDRLAARHLDSETGRIETAVAHELRTTLAARLDLTNPEGDPT